MRHPDIKELYSLFRENPVVCTDTRVVKQGSMFFALKGTNFNANAFVKDAIDKGCKYAVIDEEQYYSNGCILVHDVLTTLQNLANFHRKKFTIPVIGITGTNGKTTTKELTSAVLSKRYKTLFTQGNLNNHIGVPLTLLNLTKEHEIAIIEMGANHVGEIAELCKIAEPGYGIITNIGKAHLEGFGGYEGVIKAKSELYNYIKENHGTIFVNADDDLLMKLSAGIKRLTYGSNIVAHIKGFHNKDSFLAKGRFILDGNEVEISSRLAGVYNIHNILAAICIGNNFEVSSESIKEAIEEYVPSNNRSQIVKKGSNTIWVDAYNANPSSMKIAIENFAWQGDSSKILILGDMFELGSESHNEHQLIADLIENQPSWNEVYLIGSEFSKVKSSAKMYNTVESFMEWLAKHPLNNSTILLKGSRGMKMERILTMI